MSLQEAEICGLIAAEWAEGKVGFREMWIIESDLIDDQNLDLDHKKFFSRPISPRSS